MMHPNAPYGMPPPIAGQYGVQPHYPLPQPPPPHHPNMNKVFRIFPKDLFALNFNSTLISLIKQNST